MIDFTSKPCYQLEDLVRLVRLLRAPGGCPWDAEQTHLSIRRNFLEEAYEACEGFDRDDPDLMCEELGDVLLQVLFHADIEECAGRFTLDDVADRECKKLVFRHPFLFGGEKTSWDEIKKQEKGQQSVTDTMRGVAASLPATWRADKLQGKAEACGFVWDSPLEALDKLTEETAELREAVLSGQDPEEELGDVLFAAVNAAKLLGRDPETVLHGACEKFIRRFAAMEQEAADSGRALSSLDRDEMLEIWNRQKHTGEDPEI